MPKNPKVFFSYGPADNNKRIRGGKKRKRSQKKKKKQKIYIFTKRKEGGGIKQKKKTGEKESSRNLLRDSIGDPDGTVLTSLVHLVLKTRKVFADVLLIGVHPPIQEKTKCCGFCTSAEAPDDHKHHRLVDAGRPGAGLFSSRPRRAAVAFQERLDRIRAFLQPRDDHGQPSQEQIQQRWRTGRRF